MIRINNILMLLFIAAVMHSCKKSSDADPYVGEGGKTGGLQIFPENNPWNTDISGETVDPNSDILINSIGKDVHLHPDFGTIWQGSPIGIPYNIVGGSQAKVNVSFMYASESDPGPYPIPSAALIEAGSDKHVLVVDTLNRKLYELFDAVKNKDNSWSAGSGAVFDLTSNLLRPDKWTSADAAGLPIFPGLVRYDEVTGKGEINHALRFTVQISRNSFIHPATHAASDKNDANLPPMGMRVRLKANFDISSFSKNVQVILKAMKKYGMFVADNGSNWYISGSPDPRWDDDELGQLKTISGSNFEVIKMGTVLPMK
jgi:hypothetical protein